MRKTPNRSVPLTGPEWIADRAMPRANAVIVTLKFIALLLSELRAIGAHVSIPNHSGLEHKSYSEEG